MLVTKDRGYSRSSRPTYSAVSWQCKGLLFVVSKRECGDDRHDRVRSSWRVCTGCGKRGDIAHRDYADRRGVDEAVVGTKDTMGEGIPSISQSFWCFHSEPLTHLQPSALDHSRKVWGCGFCLIDAVSQRQGTGNPHRYRPGCPL